MLCNRTQSGGDTYYTIDSLLCASDNNTAATNGTKLCILTPLSCNTDPIDITIDVVHATRLSDLHSPTPSISGGGGNHSTTTSRVGTPNHNPNRNTPSHSAAGGGGGGITRKSSMITRNKSSLYHKAYGSQNNSDSDNVRSGREDDYQQVCIVCNLWI